MAKKEDKYIVVKIKDFEDFESFVALECPSIEDEYAVDLDRAWDDVERDISGFKRILEYLNNQNKYIVINQDEPYANAIWDIIIAFENLKEEKCWNGWEEKAEYENRM